MKRLFLFLPTLSFIWYSCDRPTRSKVPVSYRDSTLKRYLALIDSLPYYDTNTIDYKFLKAYKENDSIILDKLWDRIKWMSTKSERKIRRDSCIKLDDIKNPKSEEAYRFTYYFAFCPNITVSTIIKYKDSTILSTLVYQFAEDTVPCKIISQKSIKVDSLNWAKFQDAIEVADLWGLKQDNGKHGNDGSILEVYGFKKGGADGHPDKAIFISRWLPANSSLLDCFFVLLKYSKDKNGCVRIE